MTLKGKTLFIAGASRGIGLAIAKRAAADGANIVIAAKTTEPNPKLPGTIYTAATEIEAAGGRALPLAVDIREEGAVLAAVAKHVGSPCETEVTDYSHFGRTDRPEAPCRN
jgi:citronellol/citronellal dehydrogenase